MAKRNHGGIGGVGGGMLELDHPRQWLGAQWPGVPPRECTPPRATRQARPEEAQRASWGRAKGGASL